MMSYELMPASPISVFIVVGSLLVTPFYLLATYAFSGAPLRQGAILGTLFLIFGAVMFVICLGAIPSRLGLPGNLIVPLVWFTPSLLLILLRKRVLTQSLSQKWLVGMQLFRFIGGVFLIEMALGNQPGIFAYPAGIGDILVSILAFGILLHSRNSETIPRSAVFALIAFGMLDFLSAFFFGFTSSPTPLQLFEPEVPNQIILFPTGMIPLFLVPYAIFFHTLSALNEIKFGKAERRGKVQA